jgi:hypothetical protein
LFAKKTKEKTKEKNPNLNDTLMMGHKVKPLRRNTYYIAAATLVESRLIVSSTQGFSLF